MTPEERGRLGLVWFCEPCGRWMTPEEYKGEFRRHGNICAAHRRQRRSPIGRRLRFAILRRDGFKCRYCGRPAPEVALHVDHVLPVVRGGTDEPDNLVTACPDCNHGKGSSVLGEEAA